MLEIFNFTNNKILNICKNCFLIINFLIFLKTFIILEKNILSYLILSLIIFLYFFNLFKKFELFTEIYLILLLYLGFWFKFSMYVIFNDIYAENFYFPEMSRQLNYTRENLFDLTLGIASFSFIIIFLAFIF